MKSIKEIIPPLRNIISINSGVPLDDILNADSIRGAYLTKMIGREEIPYTNEDTVIIFSIEEDDEDQITETGLDGVLRTNVTYGITITIYSDNARTISLQLRSRLLQSTNIELLRQNGIYLKSISQIDGVTELINQQRWIRREFVIKVLVVLEVDKIVDDEDLEEGEISLSKGDQENE